MRFDTLDAWLSWQETLHPTAMDLGLERVRDIAERMRWPERRFPLITVAGTNGKGSTVSWLESALVAAGTRVGTYTSPHLVRYNERIRVDGQPVSDSAIMRSFAALDEVRGDTTLTYFEFGTLAAMDRFVEAGVEVAVMEVGIGGLLDAVNVFDADVAVVTTVDLDHQRWLGDTRDAIGTQKAGIMRAGRQAVSGERSPPDSVREHAGRIGAPLAVLGEDYDHDRSDDHWTWRSGDTVLEDLPWPALAGDFQLDNASAAIRALHALPAALVPDRAAVSTALQAPGLDGRFGQVASSPDVIVDVGHNPQAVNALAANLRSAPCEGRTLAVAGLFTDKALEALEPLETLVDAWFVTGLDGPRGDDGERMAAWLEGRGRTVARCAGSLRALEAALAEADSADRVVAFGSFHVVGDILAARDTWTHS